MKCSAECGTVDGIDRSNAASRKNLPGGSTRASRRVTARRAGLAALERYAFAGAAAIAILLTGALPASSAPPAGGMGSSVDLLDPMSRESSGTAWQPDSTPLFARMWMRGRDMLMLHGEIWPRFTWVGSRRGDSRFDAPSWAMAMYSHPLGQRSQLGAHLMMSLDPLIEGRQGYPLLFQTGETAFNVPLHDRQHPHNLWAEASGTYSYALDGHRSLYLYLADPGEPALGPPAFMHRASASDDPDAPISHHWQDSTHITFGVVTVGFADRQVKVEGSVFRGREPRENRYIFESIWLDSSSARISWNPSANLALQLSHGYIHSPEQQDPTINEHRTTASILFNRPAGVDSNLAATFVWGQNDDTLSGRTNSYLLEANYQRARNDWYVRAEQVGKSRHDLSIADIFFATPRHFTGRLGAVVETVQTATAGYVHDFRHPAGGGVDIGLGGQVTVNLWPSELHEVYGSNPGFGFELYLRLRAARLDRARG